MEESNAKPVNVGARLSFSPIDILCLEADANYTNIYLKTGETHTVSYTLGMLQKRLLDSGLFIRPNRNTLLNMQYINKIKENAVSLKLTRRYRKPGETKPRVKRQDVNFSRRRKEECLILINAFRRGASLW